MKIYNFKKSSSFTLVEVLVIIAIIAIFTGVAFFIAFKPAQEKARDVIRFSDLRQIQNALSMYHIDSNKYPPNNENYEIEGAPWGGSWNPYLPTVPKDPLSSQRYIYVSDTKTYQLYVKFEREDNIDPVFACGACGPDGEYNGGISSDGLLISFDTGGGTGGEDGEEEIVIIPQGKQTYQIQGTHSSPNFLEATIDPVDVKVGDSQIMNVKITDTYSVTSVTAAVETDTGEKIYTLSLIEGTDTNGTWQGSWTVHDTHSAKYLTTFTALNSNNESNSVTLTWSDPCTPPTGGNWTLDANCSISGTTGVDNGNFAVDGDYTMTLQPGSTFVFNSGNAIYFVNGSIAKGVGAQIRKTNLWMVDADTDGYPATTTQYAQDTLPENGVRRYEVYTYSSVDINDVDVCTDNTTTHVCGQESGGVCVAKAAGEQGLAACKRCDGVSIDAVNVTDNTQDAEGSYLCNATCKKCSSGSCVNQTSEEDLFAHCSNAQCYTGNCDGSGACGYYTSGEHNCTTACTTCTGATSGSCVNIANNTQDAEGSSLCNSTCKKCSSGSCINQTNVQDLFNHCSVAGTNPMVILITSGTCNTICAAQTYADGLCSGSGGTCKPPTALSCLSVGNDPAGTNNGVVCNVDKTGGCSPEGGGNCGTNLDIILCDQVCVGLCSYCPCTYCRCGL